MANGVGDCLKSEEIESLTLRLVPAVVTNYTGREAPHFPDCASFFVRLPFSLVPFFLLSQKNLVECVK